jgi:F0F1-type ATP synthase assembly protein I
MQKEFREIISNRSSVLLGAVIKHILCPELRPGGGRYAAGAGGIIFFIAAMLSVFMAYTFDAQVFLREKSTRWWKRCCAPR